MYNLALFPYSVYSMVSCSLIFCANDFLTVIAGFWTISLGFTALWSSTIFSGFLSSLTQVSYSCYLNRDMITCYLCCCIIFYQGCMPYTVLRTCLSTKLFSICTPINTVLSQKCFYEFLLDFHSHLCLTTRFVCVQ